MYAIDSSSFEAGKPTKKDAASKYLSGQGSGIRDVFLESGVAAGFCL
jgi:hypothetical protein